MNDDFDKFASDMVKAVLSKANDEIIKKANSGLNTTRDNYLSGLSPIKMVDSTTGKLTLEGKFPVMIEDGYTRFDMKPGFSVSPKKKETLDGGWYLTIPFRNRVKDLPTNIKKEATKLEHKGALSDLLVRSLGYKEETSFTGYTWHSPKYTGLTRYLKEYKSGKKHSSYVSFRRVSDKSSPKAFHHPGYKGLHAFDEVSREVDKFALEYMENSL